MQSQIKQPGVITPCCRWALFELQHAQKNWPKQLHHSDLDLFCYNRELVLIID